MKVCVSFQNRTACDDGKTSSRIPYQFEFLKYPVTLLSNNQFVVMQFSEPHILISILLCHKVKFVCPSYIPFFIRDNFWVQPQNFFNKNKLSLKQFLIANRLMKLNVSYFSLNKIKNRKISKKWLLIASFM